ncbi:hypothetical protein MPSEU_000344200 [Mayamaea pseudoterrestris]|nr:hypothetical protein MPSEU_000344200 [Mayamaea pseudoterrestris]
MIDQSRSNGEVSAVRTDRRRPSAPQVGAFALSDDNGLKQENERLKRELDIIKTQFSMLQQKQQQDRRLQASSILDATSQSARNVVIEQPTSRPDGAHQVYNSHESEPVVRRRKDDHLLQQQALHHRHHKSPKPMDYDADCEHGMVEVVDTTQGAHLPTMPLLTNSAVSQPYSNSLADSMDPTYFLYQVQDRAQWLVGLLVLQSMSSFIIARNEALLQKHLVLVQFLTMLVGAGGNAGNQSSVRVIRGLATGQITSANIRGYLLAELKMAGILCTILGTTGCVRTLLFLVPLPETVAITTSLCIIVMTSIVLGALLPLGMRSVNIDPAHSSTTIQVIMDILGVTITVAVGTFILDSPLRQWFVWRQ